MRAHLLATTAAVALLAAMPAHAQDATWLLNPGSNTFNTATNWNPAVVPTNTAIFGASNTTSIFFQPFTTTSIGTLQFNPDAPAYIFATSPAVFTSISITGAGIVNNSSNAPTFIVGNQANLSFRNASTAGNATIITSPGGITIFADSATGGNARLIANARANDVGVFDISSLSTGGMTAGETFCTSSSEKGRRWPSFERTCARFPACHSCPNFRPCQGRSVDMFHSQASIIVAKAIAPRQGIGGARRSGPSGDRDGREKIGNAARAFGKNRPIGTRPPCSVTDTVVELPDRAASAF